MTEEKGSNGRLLRLDEPRFKMASSWSSGDSAGPSFRNEGSSSRKELLLDLPLPVPVLLLEQLNLNLTLDDKMEGEKRKEEAEEANIITIPPALLKYSLREQGIKGCGSRFLRSATRALCVVFISCF